LCTIVLADDTNRFLGRSTDGSAGDAKPSAMWYHPLPRKKADIFFQQGFSIYSQIMEGSSKDRQTMVNMVGFCIPGLQNVK
jgi:hypothetical protein